MLRRSTHISKRLLLAFFSMWMLVVLSTPSWGWAWCIEASGAVHLEGISDDGDCGDATAGPQKLEHSEIHRTEPHSHEQDHCLDCVDIVLDDDVIGAVTGKASKLPVIRLSDQPFTIAIAMPTQPYLEQRILPVATQHTAGILPRPTIVLLI